jgi:hypothetical protein
MPCSRLLSPIFDRSPAPLQHRRCAIYVAAGTNRSVNPVGVTSSLNFSLSENVLGISSPMRWFRTDARNVPVRQPPPRETSPFVIFVCFCKTQIPLSHIRTTILRIFVLLAKNLPPRQIPPIGRRSYPTLSATPRCSQPKPSDERCPLSPGDHVSRSDRLLWGNHLVAGLGSHWDRVRASQPLTETLQILRNLCSLPTAICGCGASRAGFIRVHLWLKLRLFASHFPPTWLEPELDKLII